MKDTVTLYHNPRCSKSREALALLEKRGVAPEVIRYLDTPLSAKDIKTLLKQLNVSPRELLRTNEDAYKALNLSDPATTDGAIIKALTENPKLLQRPIAVKGDRAVIGRPPETVLELLS